MKAGTKRVVLITGASSGLGEAMAQALAQEGHWLVLAARRAERLQALAGRITAAGGRALAVPTDIQDQAQLERLVRLAVEQFGRIDLLINNAGIGIVQRADAPTDEQIAATLNTNLIAPIKLTRAVIPIMRAQRRGQIINIASVAGHIGVPGNSLYCASKHGLRAWNNALRREVSHQGIRVCLIAPGYIRTELTAGLRSIPLPGPELIAQTVLQLMQRPRREVVVPRPYAGLIWLEQRLPVVIDLFFWLMSSLRRLTRARRRTKETA